MKKALLASAGAVLILVSCAGPVKTPPDLVPPKEPAPAGSTVREAPPQKGLPRDLLLLREEFRRFMRPSNPSWDRKGFRNFTLRAHTFSGKDPLKSLFRRNGLFVRFDPPELADRPIGGDVFLADALDLLRFVEEVEGLFVEPIAPRSFLVRECVERAYRPPEGFTEANLREILTLTDNPRAEVRYLPQRGLLFVYDDFKGHRRIEEYLREVKR